MLAFPLHDELFTTPTILGPSHAARNLANLKLEHSRMLLSRRRLLHGAAAIAAQASAPAIPSPMAAHSAAPDASSLRGGEILPDPDFSLLHLTEPNIIGIRPHREGGVCLRLEDEPIASASGPKFLIHNYGHAAPASP
jgi:hypothetical protein